MDVRTNKELSEAIESTIQESGYKKAWIAEQLGIQGQNLKRKIYKDLSVDDANQILNVIGYAAVVRIEKRFEK